MLKRTNKRAGKVCGDSQDLKSPGKDPSLNLSRSNFLSYFNRCYDGGPLFYDYFLRFVSVRGCYCLLAGCILLFIDWFEQRGNVHVIADLRNKYSPIQQNMTTIYVNH